VTGSDGYERGSPTDTPRGRDWALQKGWWAHSEAVRRGKETSVPQDERHGSALRKLESNLWGICGAFTGDPGVPRENRIGTKVTFGRRELLTEIVKGTLR
jgi:hypothetical protein